MTISTDPRVAALSQTRTLSPVRLQVGGRLFVAVPAERARATAYVLAQGADLLHRRDGIVGLEWLEGLLELLRRVDAERQSEPDLEPSSRSTGSADRTADAEQGDTRAWWAHDHVTIAEAIQLTGWSAGYLARLGRQGYGVKRAGAWQLDRRRLLALAARRRRHLAGGAELAVRGSRG